MDPTKSTLQKHMVASSCSILSANNYPGWKQVMMANLQFRELWEVTKQDVMTVEVGKPLKPEIITKNNEALFILKSAIESSELLKTGMCTTAHELWKCLQENYEGTKETGTGTVAAEWAVFCGQAGEDLISYCGRFETILAKLAAVQYPVPEDQKFLFFIRSLPKGRQEFCHTWRMCNTEKSISQLVSAVKARYHTDVMIDGPSVDRDSIALITGPMKKVIGNKKVERKKPTLESNVEVKKPYKKLTCNYCKGDGHIWKYCRKLAEKLSTTDKKTNKPGTESHPSSDNKAIFMALDVPLIHQNQESWWVADSGASCHVTPYKGILVDYVKFEKPKPILTGGKTRMAVGKGVLHYKSDNMQGSLMEVLHIPGFPTNIFSLDKVVNLGYDVNINSQNRTVEITKGNELFLRGRKDGGSLLLFNLTPQMDNVEEENTCYLGAELTEWHLRMAHLPAETITAMIKNNMVKGLTPTKGKSTPCIDCLMGKQCKVSHPSIGRKINNENMSILHFDTFDACTTSLGGNRYLVIAVEESSNYRFSVPVKDKTQVKDAVKQIIRQVELESKRMVAKIVTDQGTEYLNSELRGWLAEYGISHVLSTAYAPQQNGVAERAGRAVKEAATTQLIRSGLPKTLWAESSVAATYALNRAPSPRDPTKTRYELYFGHPPDISNLRTFGQYAMVKFEDHQTKQWSPKSRLARFVNYTSFFNSFRFYFEDNKMIRQACNVRFLPLEFRPDIEMIEESDLIQSQEIELFKDKAEDVVESEVEELIDVTTPDKDINEVAQTLSINDSIHNEMRQLSGLEPIGPASNTRSKSRSSMIPIYRKLSYEGRAFYTREQDYAFFTLEGEPESLEEARRSDDWPSWKEAIHEEIKALEDNGTWELVDRPETVKVVKNRWVFANKYGIDGTVTRRKARLVAKGFTQVKNIDFKETFSPVSSLTIIRLLLAISCQLSLSLHHLDVKTAFLNGDLEETIYMEVPEGADYPRGKVCRLKKSIYGLKQASRCWNIKIDSILKKFDLKQAIVEDCFYYSPNKSMFIALYVDDLLVATNNESKLRSFVDYLSGELELTQDKAKSFLGMNITINKESIEVRQNLYIERILEHFGMMQCSPSTIPEPTGNVDYNSFAPAPEDFPFKQLVGSLMYLSLCTRPDISHAVNMASRTSKPTEAHKALLKQILKYLSGTKNLGIRFEKCNTPELIGYSDSDFANDLDTRRSTSGLLITFGGTPIWWKTGRQSIVALSSTEAEFISGCELVKEIIPVRQLLIEIGLISVEPTIIRIDNQSAIKMSQKLISRQRTKHIDVRSRWLSEQVALGTIKVEHIPGLEQKADILTKAMPKPRFIDMRRLLMTLISLLSFITIINGFTFTQVSPVYYKPTKIPYFNGTIEHDHVIKMIKPCNAYFEDLLPDARLNKQIVKDCNRWFYDHTAARMKNCVSFIKNTSEQKATNNIVPKLIRNKRVAPLLIMGYTVVSGALTYSVYKKSDTNENNIKILQEEVNNDRQNFRRAFEALNATRETIHELAESQIELQEKISYLNRTVDGFPRAMALIAETFVYLKELSNNLFEIDKGFRTNRISTHVNTLTNSRLWDEPAEFWSSFRHCSYNVTDEAFELNLEFSVPKLDSRVEILEASSFKFWNRTQEGRYCRMRYAGPRFILANYSSDCYLGVDSHWVTDGALEAHPCVSNDRTANSETSLKNFNFPFHQEICVKRFASSTSDIQVRRHNGFIHIYCLGHEITLSQIFQCPEFVFEIAATDYYKLLDHENLVTKKRGILIDPHELTINRELRRILKLDRIKIKVFNTTKLDNKIEALGWAIKEFGKNVTLPEFNSILEAPFQTISGILTGIWDYLQKGLLVIVIVTCVLMLIIISPIFKIVITTIRLTYGIICRSISTPSVNIKHQKFKDYFV